MEKIKIIQIWKGVAVIMDAENGQSGKICYNQSLRYKSEDYQTWKQSDQVELKVSLQPHCTRSRPKSPAVNSMPDSNGTLITKMMVVKFYVSIWLGYGAQLFSQTPVYVLLWRTLFKMWLTFTISRHCVKQMPLQGMGETHLIIWRP